MKSILNHQWGTLSIVSDESAVYVYKGGEGVVACCHQGASWNDWIALRTLNSVSLNINQWTMRRVRNG